MSIGQGRTIEIADNEVVRFQITGTKEQPGVVWLYMPLAVQWSLSWFSFERMGGSGPFRLEWHKGRQEAMGPTMPDTVTLHTACLGDYGEWDSTDKWLSGDGVHATGSAHGDTAGGDLEYMTCLLYPTQGRGAGAGVRFKGTTGINGI